MERGEKPLSRSSRVWGSYLSQRFSTGGPAAALSQTVEEPEKREHRHSWRPGKDYIDPPNHKKADGEEPAGTDLIRQHTADELADGIGHGLTAGDHSWRHYIPSTNFLAQRHKE